MLPALSVGLLSAPPLDGAKRRCARNLTNSPTDGPHARRAPSWRGNPQQRALRTGVRPGLDRAVNPISAAVSDRIRTPPGPLFKS